MTPKTPTPTAAQTSPQAPAPGAQPSSLRPIDLRSDTVTRPTAGMREAMARAEVGDDVYGEDPTVRALEERIAEMLGLASALYVPSGTMANQIAMGLHLRHGDEVICEAGSHILHYEGGALAALWGAQPRALMGERGLLTPEAVQAAVRPRNDHAPRTRLLSLENTHNRGGGTVWPRERFQKIVSAARASGLAVHLDGARLFNAAIATGQPVSEWARVTDTTSVCFSKGLGAPVGSAIAGGRDLILEARRLRKRLGGGMRQVGILAAGALYALEHHVSRLAEDHENAQQLARGLMEIPGVSLDPSRVQTNLLFADFPLPAAESVTRLRQHGVLANAEGTGANTLRLVLHLDVSRADVDEVLVRTRRAFA